MLKHLFTTLRRKLKTHMRQRSSDTRQPYRRWGKRTIDLGLSTILFIIILPILLLITLCILLQGCPPIFLQKRIGRHCKPFNIIKFKTMRDTRGEDGQLLPDEQRTTLIGKLLRSTSLDELPEILNVIMGDMSLIGPRPWVPEQMETFPEHTQQRRMAIRPGITGLAQILGRNNLTFRQRVSYDLRYQRNLTPRMDSLILLYTLYKVIRRQGIAQRPDALIHKNAAPYIIPPKDPATIALRGNKPHPIPTGGHSTHPSA